MKKLYIIQMADIKVKVEDWYADKKNVKLIRDENEKNYCSMIF